MWRYVRAFFIALRMTLRGETVTPAPSHPQFSTWAQEGAQRVAAVYTAAEQERLDSAARQAIKVRVDGRDTSVEVILGTLQHHMTVEYPYLIRHHAPNHLTAIQANNLNDQYRVECLQRAPQLQSGRMQDALAALKAHLDAVPSIDNPPNL